MNPAMMLTHIGQRRRAGGTGFLLPGPCGP